MSGGREEGGKDKQGGAMSLAMGRRMGDSIQILWWGVPVLAGVRVALGCLWRVLSQGAREEAKPMISLGESW
jgi:hypothetical protein